MGTGRPLPPTTLTPRLVVYHRPEGRRESAWEPILLHLGPRTVWTWHATPVTAWAHLRHAPGMDAEAWVASLMRPLFREQWGCLERLTARIAAIEDEMIQPGAQTPPQVIVDAKREALCLRRVTEREHLTLRTIVLGSSSRPLRACCLEASSLAAAAALSHETATGVLNAYYGALGTRQSDVVKSLAIVTTVLVPASLVAALYGMNLRYLPLADHPLGFWIVSGLMVLTVGAVLWAFRRRRWL